MLHAVIMAGGSGSRLWPESTPLRPKQFLRFHNDVPMILAAYNSLFNVADFSRIIVSTGEQMVPLVHEAIPTLSRANILVEPMPRNTAPCIGLAAVFMLRSDPEATMIVLPADHVIEPVKAFRETLRFAAELVEESPEMLVTIGVPPKCPATSYGYIETKTRRDTSVTKKWESLTSVRSVSQFHEKPDMKTAQKFIETGHFRWNTGIFIWKARRILELIDEFQPDMGKHLHVIADSVKNVDFPDILKREFEQISSISIDYAVLEHVALEYASGILCIDAPFSWDDAGTWQALDRLNPGKHDANGNLEDNCRLIAIDAKNNIVRSDDPKHPIALVGVSNLIVIQTKNGTLVADKNQEEKIRKIMEN